MTPKLKPGDTFIYTKEMCDKDNCPAYSYVGKVFSVDKVESDLYVSDGLLFSIKAIDPFLGPKTDLEDVEEGDILVSPLGHKSLVLGRAGRVVWLSPHAEEPGLNNADPLCYSIKALKDEDYKYYSPEPETIEIEGKKYTVSEIKEALTKSKK